MRYRSCWATTRCRLLLADVNIYLCAFRQEGEHHFAYRTWLADRLSGDESFGVSELVLSGFVRIVTNHRVYKESTRPEAAIEFCEVVLKAPSAVPLRPGPRHWAIFSERGRSVGARANTVPAAYLTALAIEHQATWVTLDQGFVRFPCLRVEHALGR
jgi:hypothetical protein